MTQYESDNSIVERTERRLNRVGFNVRRPVEFDDYFTFDGTLDGLTDGEILKSVLLFNYDGSLMKGVLRFPSIDMLLSDSSRAEEDFGEIFDELYRKYELGLYGEEVVVWWVAKFEGTMTPHMRIGVGGADGTPVNMEADKFFNLLRDAIELWEEEMYYYQTAERV